MRFRLVPKLVTLNDPEPRNGVILRYSANSGSFRGALRKNSRSLSYLLMSSCSNMEPTTSEMKVWKKHLQYTNLRACIHRVTVT